MSISSALNNATLGLTVASKLAETVSSNVMNATTPGYGRRVAEVSSLALSGVGTGARVSAVVRTESLLVTAERRSMDAAQGAAGAISETYERIVTIVGEPGSQGSLVSRVTKLETSLMTAVSEPQSFSRLSDAVSAAKALAQSLNAISAQNTQIRSEANAEITRQVETVNIALNSIQSVNDRIREMNLRNEDINGLIDERHRIIDSISSIIPIRTVTRDGGELALYSANGAVLLDGRVFELKFEQGPSLVTNEMTLGGGLNGLAQDLGGAAPKAISVGTGAGLLDGGSLGALFQLRDRIVPEFNAEIDIYAQDLIDRFREEAPAAALDAAGDGLFVDSAPSAAAGVAGRLTLNAAVDPAQGGETWRLRDGLQAATPGDEGFGETLQGLGAALSAQRAPAGLLSQNAPNSAALIASEITSFIASKSARSDDARAFLTSRQTTLANSESNIVGVNTDSELQTLMTVENAYAANARVLSTIDALLKILMEI